MYLPDKNDSAQPRPPLRVWKNGFLPQGAPICPCCTISVTLSWNWHRLNFSDVAGAMETAGLFLISHPNTCCSASQQGACSPGTGYREQSCASVPPSCLKVLGGLSPSARTEECSCLRSDGVVLADAVALDGITKEPPAAGQLPGCCSN